MFLKSLIQLLHRINCLLGSAETRLNDLNTAEGEFHCIQRFLHVLLAKEEVKEFFNR